MASTLNHSERPFRVLTVGAAAFLVLYALIAVWILSATTEGDRISVSADDGAVVVSGRLPTTEARDALFAALSAQGDITVIVSEVTITPEAEPPPPIDELADRLLEDLGEG